MKSTSYNEEDIKNSNSNNGLESINEKILHDIELQKRIHRFEQYKRRKERKDNALQKAEKLNISSILQNKDLSRDNFDDAFNIICSDLCNLDRPYEFKLTKKDIVHLYGLSPMMADNIISEMKSWSMIYSVLVKDEYSISYDIKDKADYRIEYMNRPVMSKEEREMIIREQEKKEIAQRIKDKYRRRQLEKLVRQELIDSGELFGDQPKRPRIPREVVDAVYKRDGGRCVYCGSTNDLQLDHIIPFSKGGATTVENLQLLCRKCNIEKSNKIG